MWFGRRRGVCMSIGPLVLHHHHHHTLHTRPFCENACSQCAHMSIEWKCNGHTEGRESSARRSGRRSSRTNLRHSPYKCVSSASSAAPAASPPPLPSSRASKSRWASTAGRRRCRRFDATTSWRARSDGRCPRRGSSCWVPPPPTLPCTATGTFRLRAWPFRPRAADARRRTRSTSACGCSRGPSSLPSSTASAASRSKT